jgi:hypothetical protein
MAVIRSADGAMPGIKLGEKLADEPYLQRPLRRRICCSSGFLTCMRREYGSLSDLEIGKRQVRKPALHVLAQNNTVRGTSHAD